MTPGLLECPDRANNSDVAIQRGASTMVDIHDLTLRDGLMAHPLLPVEDKVALAGGLLECGIRAIEAARFPLDGQYAQFADTIELLRELQVYRARSLRVDVFGFGEQGIHEALEHAHEFDNLHIPCFISDSYARYAWGAWDWQRSHVLLQRTLSECERAGTGLTVGVGTVFGCPFEGTPKPADVIGKIGSILELGVTELMIGDTIGAATPATVRHLLCELLQTFPHVRFRVHFHNAYGRALLNTWSAIELGAHAVDTSLLGLGGEPHPYFMDPTLTANGNCSTEELLLLSGADSETAAGVLALARGLASHVATPPSRASFAELVHYDVAAAGPMGH
jgi:hydroxymethylglutaryl-CoA lyase